MLDQVQKQPPEVVYKKNYSSKFRNIQPTPNQPHSFMFSPLLVSLSPLPFPVHIQTVHTSIRNCFFFHFGTTVSEKRLFEGVVFIIKILIKSLSDVPYLFVPFPGDEIIDRI